MKDVATRRISHVAEAAEERLAGVGERLDEMSEAAADFAHETKRAVELGIRDGLERIEDATYEAELYIRRHPFKSVLIAIGAGTALGVLISQLFNRRK